MIMAKFDSPTNGYPHEQEYSASRLSVDTLYKMKNANVGRYSSTVTLEDVDGIFNSVQFSFYNEDGEEVDICKMKEFYNFFY
jgi:hypothetical protein